jgi:hypothetical protein
METSSNKNGCWVRQKLNDGSEGPVLFISSEEPAKNYKSLITPAVPIPEGQAEGPRVKERNSARTIPPDPCEAHSAGVEKFKQWVDYARLVNSPNLAVNVSKLAAASSLLEECRTDMIAGSWIMDGDEGIQKSLVSIEKVARDVYRFTMEALPWEGGRGELRLSGATLTGNINANALRAQLQLQLQGVYLRGFVGSIEQGRISSRTATEWHRPGPGGIESETAQLTVNCHEVISGNVGKTDTGSSISPGCTPGATRTLQYLKPGKWFVNGSDGYNSCSADIILRTGETRTVNLAPLGPQILRQREWHDPICGSSQ